MNPFFAILDMTSPFIAPVRRRPHGDGAGAKLLSTLYFLSSTGAGAGVCETRRTGSGRP